MRLAIMGPTLDRVPASFAFDFAHLFAASRESGRWQDVKDFFVQSTYVHVGREFVLESAMRWGATHLLWIDTDMSFPEDAADRLARHDLDVVACNCVMKTKRPIYTAVRNGRRIPTTRESSGLEQVDTIGLAVMLMRASIVHRLSRPWFRHGYDEDLERDIGEDIMFCRALTTAGVPIFIDHDVSKEIGHIGHHTYRTLESGEVAHV